MNNEFGVKVDTPFFIVSKMASGRYIDILPGRYENMVIKTPNGRLSQQWYFDQRTKTIKNKSNGKSLDIEKGGRSANMGVWKTNGGWF